jgi:hypothetical protein
MKKNINTFTAEMTEPTGEILFHIMQASGEDEYHWWQPC